MNRYQKVLLYQEYWILWLILFFWVCFFFAPWYFLSYTKIRELRQLVGASASEQRARLHTSEMQVMTDVVRWAGGQSESMYIVVPPRGMYPQLSIVQLWRATLLAEKSSSEIRRGFEPASGSEKRAIILVPGDETLWSPSEKMCSESSCSCMNNLVHTPIYWRLK